MAMHTLLMLAAVLAATAAAAGSAENGPEPYHSSSEKAAWKNYTTVLVRNSTNGTLFWSGADYDDGLPGTLDTQVLVTVMYNRSMDTYGWDFVQFEANSSLVSDVSTSGVRVEEITGTWSGNRRDAYYAVGYAEGFTTADRIAQVYPVTTDYPMPAEALAWVTSHILFMRTTSNAAYQMELNSGDSFQVFWRKVGDLLAQMQGIADGFNAANTTSLTLEFMDVFKMNFEDEIMDVIIATKPVGPSAADAAAFEEWATQLKLVSRRDHCSALVKNTGDDIFFSHVTWGGYRRMLRQFKTYGMETYVSMSGMAGLIASGDDWYMTSRKLGVMETTNEYYNNTLARLYVVPDSASEFIRAMVANYVATDGPSWAKAFITANNGAYCNQYMILDSTRVDFSQQTEERRIPKGVLTVIEQMPGDYESGDQSALLRNEGYFASYNRPFYPKIFNKSGFEEMEREYGPFYSHNDYARALIFARDEGNVTDLAGMKKIMRYNEWATDSLSKIPNCTDRCDPPNSPWLTIAARGDLVKLGWTLPAGKYGSNFNQSASGAKDAKITSVRMLQSMSGHLVNGPTAQMQPYFNWTSSPFPHLRPAGQPEAYNFPWVRLGLVGPVPSGPEEVSMTTAAVVGVIVGLTTGVTLCAIFIHQWTKKRERKVMPDGEALGLTQAV